MKYGLFKTNILIYHFTTLPGELTCHPAGTFEDDDLPFSHLVGYGLVSWRVIWNPLFHEGWCLENKLLLFSNNLEPLKPPIQSCLKNMYFPMSSRIFFCKSSNQVPFNLYKTFTTFLTCRNSSSVLLKSYLFTHNGGHVKRAFWLLFSRMESAKRRREVGNREHVRKLGAWLLGECWCQWC